MRFIFFYALFLLPTVTYATALSEKKLQEFESIALFDTYLENLLSDCLDNSYGGSKVVDCFSRHHSNWDRELDYYYNQLATLLESEDLAMLEKSQVDWVDARESAIDFNSFLLDKRYAERQGTMFMAMRASDVFDTILPMTRSRALLLKHWHEQLVN
ncbi:hypothetical protein CWE09_01920 [Aliidiomarina minuta]|uniref:Lysozyme inhibitor LprI-like N-terminal domain-containing protein n=1 Tax=Aliidiomarina minuta TaxID=880057 RepID=A0A432W6B1_9GAMM|nr:lysozyme inhibitor LprI family protein [Aliidiomarina minuta]RUO25519.1 hypothetical protein CWE09_01920 [Aliidiomarina minuta]